ncbi:MAG TPA: hypothetical protein VGI81_20355 [Tepidisphaeraceae bacterium]|jgi:hypothetical protein
MTVPVLIVLASAATLASIVVFGIAVRQVRLVRAGRRSTAVYHEEAHA